MFNLAGPGSWAGPVWLEVEFFSIPASPDCNSSSWLIIPDLYFIPGFSLWKAIFLWTLIYNLRSFFTQLKSSKHLFSLEKKKIVSHWSNTALCAFLYVVIATANKIDHGFYRTVRHKKTVTWVAMLNVRSRSITAGLIDCKLITGSVYRSLRDFLSHTPWILPLPSIESPSSSSCIQHYLPASLRFSLTNTCLA